MRAIDLTLAMCLAAACATPSRNSLHPGEKGAAIQAIDKVLDDLHRAPVPGPLPLAPSI
jgi:hypothetical protein